MALPNPSVVGSSGPVSAAAVAAVAAVGPEPRCDAAAPDPLAQSLGCFLSNQLQYWLFIARTLNLEIIIIRSAC